MHFARITAFFVFASVFFCSVKTVTQKASIYYKYKKQKQVRSVTCDCTHGCIDQTLTAMTMMMGTNTGVFRHLESNGLMGLRTDPVKEQGVVQCEAYVLGSVEARKNAYGDDVGTFPFKEGVKQIHIFRGDPLFSPSSETLRRYGVRSYANKPYVTATVNGLRLDEEISYQARARTHPHTCAHARAITGTGLKVCKLSKHCPSVFAI